MVKRIFAMVFLLVNTFLILSCDEDSAPTTLLECGDNDAGNTQATAAVLTDVTNVNSTRYAFSSIISGGADVDYFTFDGTDSGLAISDPFLRIDSSDAALDICVYASCSATGSITSPPNCSGAMDSTSPVNGTPGCCLGNATATDSVSFTMNCSNIDESATIVLHIKPTGGNSCVDYQMTTGF